MILELIILSISFLFAYFVFSFRKCVKISRERFQDQIVVITGASSGLGKEFAKQFYRNGSKIIMIARRIDEMEKIKKDLLSENAENDFKYEPKLVYLNLEDENEEIIKNVAQKVNDFYGGVDIIINNAGLSSRASVIETDISVDRKMMFINYLNQICFTKVLVKSMIQKHSKNDLKNRSHIVAVSSVQGRIALPYRSSYCATKHALQGFYDSLRAELQSEDLPIDVTVASPGYIKTDLSLNAMTGSGTLHGKMDLTTASGAEPESVVNEILLAIQNRQSELVTCQLNVRFMILLRPLFPNLYFWILKLYGRKQKRYS